MGRQPHPELRDQPGVQPDGLPLDRRKVGLPERKLDPQHNLRKVRRQPDENASGESRFWETAEYLVMFW